MRARALHWVLGLPLQSSPKFVLLVLVLLGDDQGVSYPSQRWLARAVGRNAKTVRAALAELRQLKLLTWRMRRIGANAFTSNVYVVAVPPAVMAGRELGQGARRPASLVPGGGFTTGQQQQTDSPVLYQRDNGGAFVFPEGLGDQERAQIARMLSTDRRVGQQILDELAARMNAGGVRAPMRYAMGLIKKHRDGEFAPDRGLRVAGERLASEGTPASDAGSVDRRRDMASAVAALTAQKVVPLRSKREPPRS